MKRRLAALLLALTLLAGPLATAAHPEQPPAGSTAAVNRDQQLVDGLNGIRALAGTPKLESDAAVQAVAVARARDMAGRGYFSHYSPEGGTVFDALNAAGAAWSYAGEVIARTDAAGEEDAFWVNLRALAASPPHYGVIIDGRYAVVGAANVRGADGWWYSVGVLVQP